MARSILKEKRMACKFRGEAVRHSIYVLNRLPTCVLVGRTTYEAWSGKVPNLEHLKVFGCVAHMKIPSVQVRKLDDRSKIMVYLGKEPGTKGCMLYDPGNNSLQVSKDIVFEESKSWPSEKEPENSSAQKSFVIIEGSPVEDSSDVSEPTTPASETTTPVNDFLDVDTQEQSRVSDSNQSSKEESEPRQYRRLSDIYNDLAKR